MNRVLIIANTFSVSILFRSSLLTKLEDRKRLKGIYATGRDYQSLVGSKIKAFYPKPTQSSFCCLLNLLKDPHVSVLHSFTHIGNLIGIFGALFFQKKVVLTVTGMGRAFNHSGLLGFLCRVGVRTFYFFAHFFASAIIVQNSDDYRELERLVLKRFLPRLLMTAGSGIPLDYFEKVVRLQPLPANGIKVGFFSRALPQKGVSQFYSLALRHSSEQELNFLHLGYPGKNEFHSDRIQQTAQLSNVSYFGSTLDLRPWLLAVDIVVIPSSYREGVSRLLIESMLAGKIVVAKNTTGVRDHLKDGVNGILYASDSELFMAFERALSALNGPIPENAKAYAEQFFDVDLVNDVYFDAYRWCGLGV